jgi:predicted HTH domain antitoxin
VNLKMTTERTQVNIRLERQLLEELDEMALEESVDRAELARRLLRDGLKRERVARAMRRYREGDVSAARAAEEARISLYEILDRIRAEGIPYELDTDELDRINAMIGAGRPAGVNEQTAQYAAQRADAVSGIDDCRCRDRPSGIRDQRNPTGAHLRGEGID